MEDKVEKIVTFQNDIRTRYMIRKMGMEYKIIEDHRNWNAEPYLDECIGLERVAVLPDEVKRVYAHFKQCPNLEKIVLPKEFGNDRGEIGSFKDITTLKEIEAHPQNSNLSAVNGVLFRHDLESLIAYPCARQGSYTIPEECIYVAAEAFANCQYLSSIRIHKGVRFGYRPFANCTGLQSIIFDDGVDIIPDGLFNDCENIVSITLPISIKTIEKHAFKNPKAVKEIILPEALLPQQELFNSFSRNVTFISCEDGHVLGTPKSLQKQVIGTKKRAKADKPVWALCATQKSYKQCSVTLESGKTYAYASAYSIKKDDIAVIGTKLKKSAYLGKSSGQIVKVAEIAQQFTANRNYMLTLDFAFTKSPTNRIIQSCREILKDKPSVLNMCFIRSHS